MSIIKLCAASCAASFAASTSAATTSAAFAGALSIEHSSSLECSEGGLVFSLDSRDSCKLHGLRAEPEPRAIQISACSLIAASFIAFLSAFTFNISFFLSISRLIFFRSISPRAMLVTALRRLHSSSCPFCCIKALSSHGISWTLVCNRCNTLSSTVVPVASVSSV